MTLSNFSKNCMAILFVVALSFSCTKETTPPTLTQATPKEPYSIEIVLNNWTFSDGIYKTTFSMPEGASSIYVINKGVKQQIGSEPIDLNVGSGSALTGKLWLNTYGMEAVLSSSNASNINPGTIVLEVDGTK
jgi:hypothetical protein